MEPPMVTIEITADTADQAMEALRALARGEGPTVADKVDERLAELKELGAFDPPTCQATRGTCEGPR